MKTLSFVKPRERLSNHIHIRLTYSDYNQITKACNSAVALGEPVVVNTGLLESVQQLIRENGDAIKTIVANLTKSTVR